MPPTRPPRQPASAARSRSSGQPSDAPQVKKHLDKLELTIQFCGVPRNDVLPVVCEGKDIIYCKLCNQTLSSKDGVVRAIYRHVCTKIHIERMATKLQLDRGTLEPPPITCEVCGESMARTDSLTRHMKQHPEKSSGGRRTVPIQRSSSVPAVPLPPAQALTRSSSLPSNSYALGRSSSMPQTHFQSNLRTPYTQPSVHYGSATTSYPSYPDSFSSYAPPNQFVPCQSTTFYAPAMHPYDRFTSVSNDARRTSTFPPTQGPSYSNYGF